METRSPRELLAEWLAGELDAIGTAQLLEHCRNDPTLLEETARLKSFDRLLQLAAVDAGEDAFIAETAARCGTVPASRNLIPDVKRRLHWRKWTFSAAAACLALAAAIGGYWRLAPVAVVARQESAQWSVESGPLESGASLARGKFALTSGFAALRFHRGAELLIEGPAEFELLSSSRVRLRSGSAFAHVPNEAIGFTVEGPTGRVVDKGTDFGVRVGEKSMEVHVLKGLVEAGKGSKLQPLRENEALHMSAGTVDSIPADAGRFRTELPPDPRRPIGWVRWSFDENEGTISHAATAGLPNAGTRAVLTTLDGAQVGPRWTTGQFGAALHFDGTDDFVQTDFPGISGSAARTVAFWVKLPRDFEPRNGYSLVCWGSSRDLKEGWQISINPKEEYGPLGRLRVGRIGGPIVGTTDLRDDRWHHVAVIFYGDQAERSTQVLIYVDGELETTDRKSVGAIHTDTAGPDALKVAFGLNIGPANPNPARPPTWRVFRGCLDEVFICDAALNQGQVRDLMTRNSTSALAPLP